MLLTHSICSVGLWYELASLRHDLHLRMYPFQAPHHHLDGLVFGRFGENAQDINDLLWCEPLSMELVITAVMFPLPFGCIAIDWQA